MIGNKTKTYFFSLFSFIAISLITITSIIIGTTGFVNSTSNNKITSDLLASDLNRDIEEDKKMDNFLKERTLSLYFANKNNNSISYSGTYGTGWIYGFSDFSNVKSTNEFKIYVATNIHVIDDFITTDFKLDFDVLFLQFFKNPDDKKAYGQTNDRLFLEKKNVKLDTELKFFNNSPVGPNLSYPLNDVTNVDINNDDGLSKIEKQWYIQRSYSDLAILEFTIDNSNPILYHWMKYGFSDTIRKNNIFKSLNINSDHGVEIEDEQEPSITQIQEYYIGGFPVVDNKPIWVSKKYYFDVNKLKEKNIANANLYKARFTTAYQMLPGQFIEGCNNTIDHSEPGLHIPSKPGKNPNNYYRNVAQQLLLPYTNMGSGASGSMIVTGNQDIVGIWWGLYTNSKKGDYFGAGDLFIAPKDYLAENLKGRNIRWPSYDHSFQPKSFKNN